MKVAKHEAFAYLRRIEHETAAWNDAGILPFLDRWPCSEDARLECGAPFG
jgi:hypothetical protein